MTNTYRRAALARALVQVRQCLYPVLGKMYVFAEVNSCPRLQWVLRAFWAGKLFPRNTFSPRLTGSK
jgi:hypothetical protein